VAVKIELINLEVNLKEMKAVEFKAKIKNRLIKVPKNIGPDLSEGKELRVIILQEETGTQSHNSFKQLSEKQFLAGYTDSDSVYDSY